MNTVLIVDDDPFYRNLYRDLLEKDYQLIESETGEEGLEKALSIIPNLVIMDWGLPEMDGLTAASIIKEKIKDPFIFMLMITGKKGNEAKIQSLEYFDDYMEKPIDTNVFMTKIQKGFRIIKAFDELQLLYQDKHNLLHEKEILISELKEERESLEQKVQERTNELDKLNKSLTGKSEEVLRDMEIASRLQHNLLPKHSPNLENYKVYSRYLPREFIGGDFYDFLEMRENKLGILLGDVSGHGIAAAFITSMVKNIVVHDRQSLPSPKIFFENLNKKLLDQIYLHFVTAAYAVFDLTKPFFTFSTAGHLPPLLYRKESDEIIELATSGTILGAVEDVSFEEKEYVLNSGDRVFLFTDGILEVFNKDRVVMSFEDLKSTFYDCREKAGEEVFNHMIHKALDYSEGGEFNDDVALILVDIK